MDSMMGDVYGKSPAAEDVAADETETSPTTNE